MPLFITILFFFVLFLLYIFSLGSIKSMYYILFFKENSLLYWEYLPVE